MVTSDVTRALQQLSVELHELDLGSEVQRLPGPLSPLQFYRDFVGKNKPCLLTGAIGHWSALSMWNKQYLTDKIHAKQVTVAVTPNGRADAVCNIEAGSTSNLQKPYFVLPCERQIQMSDFLEHLIHQQPFRQQQDTSGEVKEDNSNPPNQQEIMYLQQQNGNFISHFPELLSDIDSEIQWASQAFGASPDAINLWIGNDQSVTSFHKDHYENLYAVVTGEKTFTLLPPCDAYRMHLAHYPVATCCDTPQGLQIAPSPEGEQILWSPIEDLASGNSSEEYKRQYPTYFDPLLPKPFRVTVRAGEILYLPSLWWHQVEQTAGKDSMVIAVNYWYDMQFDCKYAYFQLVEALTRYVTESGVHLRSDISSNQQAETFS